jgi:hypothetical protein
VDDGIDHNAVASFIGQNERVSHESPRMLSDLPLPPVTADPDDPVTSPAVFDALRRANDAVKEAESRARAAERRASELVQRSVQLLTTVEARLAEADHRIRAAEDQIAVERRIAAAIRVERDDAQAVIEAMEQSAADLIAAAEERAQRSEERLRSLCDVLSRAIASHEAGVPDARSSPAVH